MLVDVDQAALTRYPVTRRFARLDAFQQRHSAAGFPIAVVYKLVDDQGPFLAALMTYYGFLSLFPLLLIFVTVLGLVLQGHPHLQAELLGSTLRQFPLVGPQLSHNVRSLHGSTTTLVLAGLGTLYGGLGVGQAGQNALNRVWGVPRNERPNPIRSRLRGLLLLVVFGVAILITTTLSALGASAGSYGADIGGGLRLLAGAASVAVNVALFLVAFRIGPACGVRLRDVWVGALCAALAWQGLQLVGTYYVAHKLRGATEVYGLFGLVLGLLAFMYLEAIAVIVCAEIDVVRRRRLWPRSLFGPFTDALVLTDADERAYSSYAQSEQFKTFQHIDVVFDPGARLPTDDG